MNYIVNFEEDETIRIERFTKTFSTLGEVLDAVDRYTHSEPEVQLNGNEVRLDCECDGVTIICETNELAVELHTKLFEIVNEE